MFSEHELEVFYMTQLPERWSLVRSYIFIYLSFPQTLLILYVRLFFLKKPYLLEIITARDCIHLFEASVLRESILFTQPRLLLARIRELILITKLDINSIILISLGSCILTYINPRKLPEHYFLINGFFNLAANQAVLKFNNGHLQCFFLFDCIGDSFCRYFFLQARVHRFGLLLQLVYIALVL